MTSQLTVESRIDRAENAEAAKMDFFVLTEISNLVIFFLKLRYPAYSIHSSGTGFIAACNHNTCCFSFMPVTNLMVS